MKLRRVWGVPRRARVKVGRPIDSLRDVRKGEPAYILGNGPSVADHPLGNLSGRCSIGMNASVLLEEAHGFRSPYYVLSDTRFLCHPAKRELATARLDAAVVRVLRKELWPFDAAALLPKSFYIPVLGLHGYSFDLSEGYYFGAGTTVLAIHLAGFLGCNPIVLLGVDLTYSGNKARFYPEENPQENDLHVSSQVAAIRQAALALRLQGVELLQCGPEGPLSPYLPQIGFDAAVG